MEEIVAIQERMSKKTTRLVRAVFEICRQESASICHVLQKIETPGRRHMSESYKDYVGCKKDWDDSSQSSINNHPIVANDDYG